MSQETTAQLIKDLRNARRLFGPDWAKRIAAAQALGAQHAGEAVGDLAAVIQENQNPDLVQAALRALSQIGTPQAVDALIVILCGSDVKQGELASQLLVSLGPQVTGRSLLSTAASSSATDRSAAENVLKQYGNITPLLISLLADSDGSIRSSAQQRLVTSGAAAVPTLLDVLINDADPAMSTGIAEILGKIGQPALGPLIRILAEGEPLEAAKAAETLVGLGQPAVAEMIELLGHRDSGTRKLAAGVLLRIGGPEVDMMKPALESWISSENPPSLLVVDAAQEKNRLTLEECIGSAADGSILALRRGTHTLHAPMSLTKSLILLGAGADQCTVICAGEQYVIQVVQGRFAASGIAFEHIGPHFGSVIEVAGGEVDLHRCACRGGVLDEIASDKGVISYRRFEVLSERFGSETYQRSYALEDVLLAGSGLWLHGQAKAIVRECHFTNNEVIGIAAEGDAQVELTVNECNGNRFHGISLCGNTRGNVANNNCHHNKASGIAVRSEADRTAEELVIESNTCRANGEAGIGFWQRSIATARNNRCIGENSQVHGIYASEEAQPEIVDNQCETNQLGGISFYKKATGTARGNKCRQNKAGIAISDEASPLIDSNSCFENIAGVYCGVEASPLVRRNTCRKNTEDGISVADVASPTLEQNVCRNNSRFGILFLDNSRGAARYNECNENKIGIYVTAEANPLLQNNTCEGNIIAGIGKQPS